MFIQPKDTGAIALGSVGPHPLKDAQTVMKGVR